MKDRLKFYRKKYKLTQTKVAKILHIAQSSYSAYEQGKNEPDIKTLKTLAELYHTSINDLVGVEQPNIINLNLLSEDERKIVEITQQLNSVNLSKLEAYAICKLEDQNK